MILILLAFAASFAVSYWLCDYQDPFSCLEAYRIFFLKATRLASRVESSFFRSWPIAVALLILDAVIDFGMIEPAGTTLLALSALGYTKLFSSRLQLRAQECVLFRKSNAAAIASGLVQFLRAEIERIAGFHFSKELLRLNIQLGRTRAAVAKTKAANFETKENLKNSRALASRLRSAKVCGRCILAYEAKKMNPKHIFASLECRARCKSNIVVLCRRLKELVPESESKWLESFNS